MSVPPPYDFHLEPVEGHEAIRGMPVRVILKTAYDELEGQLATQKAISEVLAEECGVLNKRVRYLETIFVYTERI